MDDEEVSVGEIARVVLLERIMFSSLEGTSLPMVRKVELIRDYLGWMNALKPGRIGQIMKYREEHPGRFEAYQELMNPILEAETEWGAG